MTKSIYGYELITADNTNQHEETGKSLMKNYVEKWQRSTVIERKSESFEDENGETVIAVLVVSHWDRQPSRVKTTQ